MGLASCESIMELSSGKSDAVVGTDSDSPLLGENGTVSNDQRPLVTKLINRAFYLLLGRHKQEGPLNDIPNSLADGSTKNKKASDSASTRLPNGTVQHRQLAPQNKDWLDEGSASKSSQPSTDLAQHSEQVFGIEQHDVEVSAIDRGSDERRTLERNGTEYQDSTRSHSVDCHQEVDKSRQVRFDQSHEDSCELIHSEKTDSQLTRSREDMFDPCQSDIISPDVVHSGGAVTGLNQTQISGVNGVSCAVTRSDATCHEVSQPDGVKIESSRFGTNSNLPSQSEGVLCGRNQSGSVKSCQSTAVNTDLGQSADSIKPVGGCDYSASLSSMEHSSPLFNMCTMQSGPSPQVMLGDLSAIQGKTLTNIFAQSSTSVSQSSASSTVTSHTRTIGGTVSQSDVITSDLSQSNLFRTRISQSNSTRLLINQSGDCCDDFLSEQEVPHRMTPDRQGLSPLPYGCDQSPFSRTTDDTPAGENSLVMLMSDSLTLSDSQCHLVPDSVEHPRVGVIFKEEQFCPMLTVVASPGHSCQNSPTQSEHSCQNSPTQSERSCQNSPTQSEHSHQNLLTHTEHSCQDSLTETQHSSKQAETLDSCLPQNESTKCQLSDKYMPQVHPHDIQPSKGEHSLLGLDDIKIASIKETPRKQNKLKRLTSTRSPSSDKLCVGKLSEPAKIAAHKSVRSPRLNTACQLRITAGKTKKSLNFGKEAVGTCDGATDQKQSAPSQGSVKTRHSSTPQPRRCVTPQPRRCVTPQTRQFLTPQTKQRSMLEPRNCLTRERNTSNTPQRISKTRHLASPETKCPAVIQATSSSSQSGTPQRSTRPRRGAGCTLSRSSRPRHCTPTQRSPKAKHVTIPPIRHGTTPQTRHNIMPPTRHNTTPFRQLVTLQANGTTRTSTDHQRHPDTPIKDLDPALYRQDSANDVYQSRDENETESKQRLSKLDIIDLSLLDESIILQEEKVEKERVEAEKLSQRKSSIHKDEIKNSEQKSTLSVKRSKDTYTLELSEAELDAITLVHTLCNSQQLVKRVTKARATNVIRHHPPKQPSRVRWHKDLVTDVKHTAACLNPCHIRKSILHVRSAQYVYPFANCPPSSVVVVKSSRKPLTYGKDVWYNGVSHRHPGKF